ncbi:hypothetical protein B0H15DRAFT_945182 [Mycena belliarum]|uniref:Uncharacterized protein n=1 Tax=Mycena belliarum TaxID=1033014 RepID=A0AAD6XX10_9AGAR|nr:hypothetical protein B0H15DRAFT_945182 [Mycena belliae]
MRFSQSFAVFVASALAAVSATPVAKEKQYIGGWEIVEAPTSPDIVRARTPQAPGGVFICTDINFSGTCGYAVQPLDHFGPDPGATCFAYSQNDCDEGEWEFTFPGDGTGDPWNDRITDFMCE